MKQSGLQKEIYTLLVLLLCARVCKAQQYPARDSTHKAPALVAHSRVTKNYFITQFPQDVFYIQCGLQDQSGNMWFGSAGNGAYRYDGTAFVNFTHLNGLCHDDVLCLLEDRTGTVWFGTRAGLCRYIIGAHGKARIESVPIVLENGAGGRSRYFYKAGTNFVWSLMQDRTGRIWAGTTEGVYVYDPSQNADAATPVFAPFVETQGMVNESDLQLKMVQGMQEDEHGTIWFASGEGISRYNGKALSVFQPGGLRAFRSITKRRNGTLLFLGASHGIYEYDGTNFTSFADKIGLRNDTVIALNEDRNGNVWLSCGNSTMTDNSLWRYNGGSLTLIMAKGPGNNSVHCIVEDKASNIWLGTTNTGLYRYDGTTLTDFTDTR